jgi:hypothetical protein
MIVPIYLGVIAPTSPCVLYRALSKQRTLIRRRVVRRLGQRRYPAAAPRTAGHGTPGMVFRGMESFEGTRLAGPAPRRP